PWLLGCWWERSLYRGAVLFRLRVGVGVFVVCLGLLLLRFLVPRPVGAADNGDGWRLLCKVGANQLGRPTEDYVRFSYGAGPSCNSAYVSTQAWIHRVAHLVGSWIGDGAALNLIIVGVISCT